MSAVGKLEPSLMASVSVVLKDRLLAAWSAAAGILLFKITCPAITSASGDDDQVETKKPLDWADYRDRIAGSEDGIVTPMRKGFETAGTSQVPGDAVLKEHRGAGRIDRTPGQTAFRRPPPTSVRALGVSLIAVTAHRDRYS